MSYLPIYPQPKPHNPPVSAAAANRLARFAEMQAPLVLWLTTPGRYHKAANGPIGAKVPNRTRLPHPATPQINRPPEGRGKPR